MRIISGIHKGKRLTAPKKLPVRPTTDIAKEGLFNILNNRFYFPEITIIDLFAGTGNIAYEFSSRGADHITAVDANYGCVSYIAKTAKELDANIDVIKSDVFQYLEKNAETADIIFADPPYDLDLVLFKKIAELVFKREKLNPDGVLIIEHSKHTDLSDEKGFVSARRYGSSVFSFFEF